MDQNPPVLAKKVWSLIRIIFFTFKKTIFKTRLFADFNIMMKRGKLAGKSLHNLLFHHHRNWAATTTSHRHPHHLPFPSPPPTDDELSCTASPQLPFSDHGHQHKKTENKSHAIPHAPSCKGDIDEIVIDEAVMIKAVESLVVKKKQYTQISRAAVSPGFGKSPVVRQLRITDSPFPLSNGDGDGKVDEDAEMFILKFYNALSREE
ncbi:hypothetical protein QVD17_02644 [Tagetes erecta]|uniref:Avr9/Cf-9 rapidly elicited protein n=1 Tax=Tagetes erecta TaxID=13708 RepID=A0AAD8P2M2_TARER|nr:hypothetical protein QVD17_02644 [Tagetes erecta]